VPFLGDYFGFDKKSFSTMIFRFSELKRAFELKWASCGHQVMANRRKSQDR